MRAISNHDTCAPVRVATLACRSSRERLVKWEQNKWLPRNAGARELLKMFENLQEKLQRTFKNLRGQGTLTPENIQEAMKEIRMALLEADVNFKVVKDFVDHVQEKAVGQEVMTALSPAQQVVKLAHDE